MLFRKVQIPCRFEGYRNLIGESASAPNILLRNASPIQSIEQSKHAQQSPARAEQWHRQELMHFVLGNHVHVHAKNAAGLIGPENFLSSQDLGCNTFRENVVQPPRLSLLHTVSHLELIV